MIKYHGITMVVQPFISTPSLFLLLMYYEVNCFEFKIHNLKPTCIDVIMNNIRCD